MTKGVYGLLGDSSLFCKKSNGSLAQTWLWVKTNGTVLG